MTIVRISPSILLFLVMAAASYAEPPSQDSPEVSALLAVMERLRPLHTQLGEPRPGDWLARFDEPGQTFREYLDSDPVLPRGQRHVIYIQPLGDFTESQRKIINLTADFVARYFQLAVKVEEDLSLESIPEQARRKHPVWQNEQILTGYVLDEVLSPRLPDDAAAYIALTACDLWPGEGWNYVFGQASTRHRVGVWSIYRNGSTITRRGFRRCLLRTLKTATHELGHMIGMHHCTAYECNMCGSNHREERDRHPLALCPECLAKLCWATGCEPVERYRQLAAFCREHGLETEAEFCER
jgi:archaemetzincin